MKLGVLNPIQISGSFYILRGRAAPAFCKAFPDVYHNPHAAFFGPGNVLGRDVFYLAVDHKLNLRRFPDKAVSMEIFSRIETKIICRKENFMPPYVITEEEIDRMMEVAYEGIGRIKK